MTEVVLPPVPLWRLFLRLRGWIAILLMAISAALTFVSQTELTLAERFDTEGRLAYATIEDRYKRQVSGSEGRDRTVYYFVLTYETQAGKHYRVTETVPRSLYRFNKEGQILRIRYLASEPTRIETRRGVNRTTSRILQGAALGVGLAALFLFWRIGRRAVAAGRARAYGARETATVVAIREVARRRLRPARDRLVWRDPAGRDGTSLPARPGSFRGLSVGDGITIYQGIGQAWWAGDIGDRDAI